MRLATLLWLVTHFALTAAYVMPLNPLKVALRPLLQATIGTFFQQNWSLFAPNPVSSNKSLLARCLAGREAEDLATAGLPADGWYDLSGPLWARFQRNRFSAYDRLSRPQSNAIRQYQSGSVRLLPWWQACEKGDSDSCAFLNEQLQLGRSRARRLLARIGSAFCKDVAESGDRFTHVALRIRETNSVPWSERYTGEPEKVDIEVGVFPVDERVVIPGLFKATAR